MTAQLNHELLTVIAGKQADVTLTWVRDDAIDETCSVQGLLKLDNEGVWCVEDEKGWPYAFHASQVARIETFAGAMFELMGIALIEINPCLMPDL